MTPLIIDTETDIYNNGHPFDKRNNLVCASWYYNNGPNAERWDDQLASKLQSFVDACDLLVGFNFKFDYHWLHNNGLVLAEKRIWDCQLAHYILTHQQHIFPSMNEVAEYYSLPTKLDVVKLEYWEKDITTSQIPWDILREYAAWDAELTYLIFQRQWSAATQKQKALIFLVGSDMHVLREMECEGIRFDEELCNKRAQEIDDQIRKVTEELRGIYPNVPINFASNDHLSAFLYGGCVEEVKKVHDGFYKTGQRAGQIKLKNEIVTHKLPQLYKPVRGSELKKEGYYATNEPTLRQLRGNPKIINKILELAKLEKMNGTYYLGLPKLRKTMGWDEGILHGQFNQCQTATGRLSSSKPNLQNFGSELQDIFVSNYNNNE